MKVVGFIGRWLLLLGLIALWIWWVMSWIWSAASVPMASQTPMSLTMLAIVAFLVAANLVTVAFTRKEKAYELWGYSTLFAGFLALAICAVMPK